MEKERVRKIALVVIIVILIVGFGAGLLLKKVIACTEMGCLCKEDGKMPCNTCQSSTPVFFSGVLNVIQDCTGREIIECDNGEQIDFDFEEMECEYRFSWIFRT